MKKMTFGVLLVLAMVIRASAGVIPSSGPGFDQYLFDTTLIDPSFTEGQNLAARDPQLHPHRELRSRSGMVP